MKVSYPAGELAEPEFEILQALSINGIALRSMFSANYEAVGAFPESVVDQAIQRLENLGLIVSTSVILTMTDSGRKAIQFSE